MKTKLLALLLLAALPATPVFFSGCAQAGYEKTIETKNDVLVLKSSLTDLNAQIGTTSNLLTALVSDTKTAPDQRYKDFAAAVDKTVSLDAQARSAAETVQESARATVEQRRGEGDKISDADLRSQMQKQLSEYAKRFDKIKEVTNTASSSVREYVTKITDLKTALGADLSPDSLASKQSFAKDAVSVGKDAVENVQNLLKLINEAAAQTAPASVLPATVTQAK